MNLRFEILKAVAANPGAPINEIADAISYDRQKTAWSVRDCAQDGLLAKRLDDVTRQPGYTLTDAGKKRLAEGPAKLQGGNLKKGAKTKTSFNAGPRDRAEAKAKAKAEAEAVSEPVAAEATVKESLTVAPEEHPADSASKTELALPIAAQQLITHKHQASYNDSYFGEPAGLVKRALYELDRMPFVAARPQVKALRDEADAAKRASESYLAARDELRRELDEVRATLAPLTGGTLAVSDLSEAAVAKKAAAVIEGLRDAHREQLNMIAIASETLAPLVSGDIDTSDMDLDELAKHVADALTTMRDVRDSASQEFASVHAENERLRSQLQTIDETCDRVEKLIHYGAEGDTAFRVQEMMDFAVQYNNTQKAAKEELRSRLANQTALVEKLEHLLQSARNEAEHLRRHVTHNEDGLDGQPLGNLLMGAREFLEVGQRVTVTGGEAKVEVRALNITFDLAPHEVSEVLEHATALERKLPVPF